MELIFLDENKKYDLGAISIALGEFDGLHLAHQSLISKTIEHAKKTNIKSAVFSFDPHPDFILKKRAYQGYITPMNEKKVLLEQLGVDYFIIIPFTVELSKYTPTEFENRILNKFDIKHIVVGFDYRYGHRGAGNYQTLQKKYNVEVVDKIELDNQKIGSNEIRNYLLAGQMDSVKAMLGRFYNITGIVIPGNKVGRELGFRTANIGINENYQVLRKGVYATFVTVRNKRYFGVCNIGNNPTVNYVEKARLEVHILDFDNDIYGEIISVDFVEFLRDEIKYNNIDDMLTQINQDVMNAKSILEKNI